MFSLALNRRLDQFIDELILDGSIEAASLASILLNAKDSIARSDHMRLTRSVWSANEQLRAASAERDESREAAVTGPGRRRMARS